LGSDKVTNEENAQEQNPALSDLRLKRDEYSIEIRKKKRDDTIRKIRISNLQIDKQRQVGGFSTLSGAFDSVENIELRKCINEWLQKQFKQEEFLELVGAINNPENDRLKQHYGMIGLRKILSQEKGAPIQHAVDMNLVPRFIEFTQRKDEPHLQLEAAWALTNIASGDSKQTEAVIEHGGIPCFVNLLGSPKMEIVEQGIWALGNIAGDCNKFRQMALESNALSVLVDLLKSTTKENIFKHGIWALSNLTRGRPLPNFELVKESLPVFSEALKHSKDPEIITDASWALYHLSDGDSPQIQVVLDTGVAPTIVQNLDNSNLSTSVPLIKTLGLLMSGDDESQIDTILSIQDVIPKLFKLLEHEKKVVRKETCYALSAITAGNDRHVGCVIANPNYLNKLITLAVSDKFLEVRREAAWVLANALIKCNIDQLMFMLQYGLLECFCTLLDDTRDAKNLEVVIEGLNAILNKGKEIASQRRCENPFISEFESRGGLEKVQKLQEHENVEVYQAALKLMEGHYELEDNLLS